MPSLETIFPLTEIVKFCETQVDAPMRSVGFNFREMDVIHSAHIHRVYDSGGTYWAYFNIYRGDADDCGLCVMRPDGPRFSGRSVREFTEKKSRPEIEHGKPLTLDTLSSIFWFDYELLVALQPQFEAKFAQRM